MELYFLDERRKWLLLASNQFFFLNSKLCRFSFTNVRYIALSKRLTELLKKFTDEQLCVCDSGSAVSAVAVSYPALNVSIVYIPCDRTDYESLNSPWYLQFVFIKMSYTHTSFTCIKHTHVCSSIARTWRVTAHATLYFSLSFTAQCSVSVYIFVVFY